jgi:cytidylate kinase
MNYSSTSDRLAEALLQAHRHWQTQGEAGPAPRGGGPPGPAAYTIALSREAGAQGATVAQAVGKKLGWPVYDRELLQRIAEEMGLRTNLLESLDEKQTHWLLESIQAFTVKNVVGESSFFRHLVETVLSLGTHGSCVIVGRGATMILPPASTLRVRLVAPREERIAAMTRRLGLCKEEATSFVAKTDRDRARFVKDHFHKDPAEAVQYDLVLNAARFSTEECADLIIDALHRMQARVRGTVSATQSAAP